MGRLMEATVHNFGSVPNGTYSFPDGLNIIRAPNEGGKTTLIEAILYSMFGTQMIRGTVEEATTDGAGGMSVTTVYGEYTVKRSKSSAAVTGPGVEISGQAAVTDFFSELLGVDKSIIDHVLVSKQGKTAGILDYGSSAVTSLIEQLAGFNQIDQLIERVKTEFPSGNKAVYEGMLTEEREELTKVKETQIPDLGPLTAEIEEKAQLRSEEKDRLERQETALSETKKDIAVIEEKKKNKQLLRARILDLKQEITLTENSLESFHLKIDQVVRSCDEEEDYISRFPTMKEEYDLWETVCGFEDSEGGYVGGLEGLTEEINQVMEKQKENSRNLTEVELQLKTHNDTISKSSDTCPTCGQDTRHLYSEMVEAAAKKISELEKVQEDLRVNQELQKITLDSLQPLLEEQKLRANYGEFAVDTNVIPWQLKWNRDIPLKPDIEKLKQCQQIVADNNRLRLEIQHAGEQIPELENKLSSLNGRLKDAQIEYDSIIVEDTKDLILRRDALADLIAEIKKRAAKYTTEIEELKNKILDIKSTEIIKRRRTGELIKSIISLREKILTDELNSLVVKEMRSAKPKVLSKVWNSVLISVSSVFSVMRNESTIVERKEKGFYANDRPIHRLSGSARSVLGIAVRQSLREVFAPEAGFLVFDEPFADCDKDRTSLVIGAITSVPGQKIVITHEELSDTSADNIIELG